MSFMYQRLLLWICLLTAAYAFNLHPSSPGIVIGEVKAGASSTNPLYAGGKDEGSFKIVARNKQASRNFELLDKYEAGIELLGTEVKSVRVGGSGIDESYVGAKNGECYIYGMNIAPHKSSNQFYQHETKRPRRLLLHKKEIKKLESMTSRQQGMTIVPLTLYFNHKNILKVSIALAKGKNVRDKRDDIKDRDNKRSIQRIMKSF